MARMLCTLACSLLIASWSPALEPIPDKLVVLTFDDSSRSHFTIARPLLLKHKFGATFFITEGWGFASNKKDYMTWEEITQLHKDGFEIGNHTRDHKAVSAKTLNELSAQVKGIQDRCKEHGIPAPRSFAYPGNAIAKEALPLLQDLGFLWARRGGAPEHPYKDGRGFAYEPGLDHPLLIPTAGDARPTWGLEDLKMAVSQARHGKIAVLQFHGVPDTAHEWVSTRREQFESYLNYLAENHYKVIALRDLAKYVDPTIAPSNAWGAIDDRKALLESKRDGSNARSAKNDQELRYWLENSLIHHRFAEAEAGAVLGLTAEELKQQVRRLQLDLRPTTSSSGTLKVLPYPGGRHPRTGFRDGAIRPQRETKVSVFAPWADGGYAVADVPEAVWYQPAGKKPEILYLAHTHVPTTWDRQGIVLDPLEWQRKDNGRLELMRTLPNRVTMTSLVEPRNEGVRFVFRIANGTAETLSGLRVQMCVMLARLHGFEARTNDNKRLASPFAACHDGSGNRWIITGWERCGRAWGNPPCPCIHADPVVEDCPAGETREVRGWLSFYEGKEIEREFKRLAEIAFRN